MHALSVEAVSFSYHRTVPILRNVSFSVERGEFLSLVGPNGSGKTTLLRLLDRIFLPEQGNILLGDKLLSRLSRTELARRIAFVPQDGGIQFPFTVYEIVLMGRAPHTRGMAFENARDRAIAREMMALTDIDNLADQPITKLSGGERQRAFIARALAQQPEILLLDEPNAHLDISHQLDVFRLIKNRNTASGLTVVSVSHDLNLAGAYSDRVAVLQTGTLVALGTPAEVLTEQRIRQVFNTDVLVDLHPLHRGPRVTLKK
jgi:iron complex transport system ATP-binding protein